MYDYFNEDGGLQSEVYALERELAAAEREIARMERALDEWGGNHCPCCHGDHP